MALGIGVHPQSYYGQYAKSFYGVTRMKSGWDCLRHYEILGSGAIPYFLNIMGLRERPFVMYAFPKDMVLEAMTLPGVPSEAEVCDSVAL